MLIRLARLQRRAEPRSRRVARDDRVHRTFETRSRDELSCSCRANPANCSQLSKKWLRVMIARASPVL